MTEEQRYRTVARWRRNACLHTFIAVCYMVFPTLGTQDSAIRGGREQLPICIARGCKSRLESSSAVNLQGLGYKKRVAGIDLRRALRGFHRHPDQRRGVYGLPGALAGLALPACPVGQRRFRFARRSGRKICRRDVCRFTQESTGASSSVKTAFKAVHEVPVSQFHAQYRMIHFRVRPLYASAAY